VLAIQDTTVAHSDGSGRQYLQAVLAVDAEDGAILGLIDGVFLHRAPAGACGAGSQPGRRTRSPISKATSNATYKREGAVRERFSR